MKGGHGQIQCPLLTSHQAAPIVCIEEGMEANSQRAPAEGASIIISNPDITTAIGSH